MKRFIQILTVGVVCGLGVGSAHADLLSVYGAAKLDSVSGTGDVFEKLSPGMAGGVEAGIEVIGIDLWGEAVWMGGGQAMYTGNFGFDLTFGGDVRFNVGLYTGPVFFEMGESDSETGGLTLSNETNMILAEAANAGISVPTSAEIQSAYDEAFGNELNALDNYAFGWNLVRGRVQIEYKLFPIAYIGVGGQYGYHYTFSGADASAGIKDEAINQLADSDELSAVPAELKTQLVNQLKQDVGAEAVDADSDDKSGTNFNAGIYFKLEI